MVPMGPRTTMRRRSAAMRLDRHDLVAGVGRGEDDRGEPERPRGELDVLPLRGGRSSSGRPGAGATRLPARGAIEPGEAAAGAALEGVEDGVRVAAAHDGPAFVGDGE